MGMGFEKGDHHEITNNGELLILDGEEAIFVKNKKDSIWIGCHRITKEAWALLKKKIDYES